MAYQRNESKFPVRGVNLSRPADLLDETSVPYALNMRSLQQGVLQNRPGMSRINTNPLVDLSIHSIMRLNNDLPSAIQTYARFLGAGDDLYSDDVAHTTFASRATGFSGKPLQFAVMRPLESPEPWVYIGDSTKSGKARVDGTFYNQGIAPPSVASVAKPAATVYTVIDSFEGVGAWTNGGTAGAITAVSRVSTTISNVIFDVGTSGWATVAPAALDESIQPGMLLIVGGIVETVLVESVADAVTNTTISAIQYDVGTTGACTIQLAAPSDLLMRDHLLRIDSGGGNDEVVRVLSVTDGPRGLPSFRCVTVNTQIATRTITGIRSFRASFVNLHAIADTLTSNNLRSSVATGIGYITLIGARDLSVVNDRPITRDDVICIGIKLDDINLLTEGRVAFDVDSTTNDFTQNYYYYPFRTNDLAPATTGAITTLAAKQRIIQRNQIEIWKHVDRNSGNQDWMDQSISGDIPFPFDEMGNQTATGASQWTELRFKVGDLIRVGSDSSRTLHDIAAIRIQLQTTGTVQLDVDAWWIGGTYGPDVGIGAPYNYIYVYRSMLTGAMSNPSPPMRSGVEVHRQRVSGTVTPSTDPQVDQIDIYRTGGALIVADNSPPWFYVMSVPNATAAFVDEFGDDIVIRNRQLSFDNYQPFLDLDIPRSGTCDVVGTEVTQTGGTDTFSTAWPPGTLITINNVPYRLYASPSSTTALSLSESAGSQTAVNWFVTAPRLQAQPLPSMWGPFGAGIFEPVTFACGSLNQPGKVFWTQPGNADAHSQFGGLELTSPSEPLVNGCIFRSQAFVLSSESLYVLTPSIINGELRFSGSKVAGNRGLFSRYAMCVGDEGIFYLSRDGIYLTNGGESVSLTDEMLYPLFSHEGAAAVTTNSIVPPDFTETDDLRLDYGVSGLYFSFIDTEGARRTLLYDIKLKGWFPYTYSPEVTCHYIEEGRSTNTMLMGATDGFLYLSGGDTDNALPIPCAVWTNWIDGGDPRANKQWANGMLDFDDNGVGTTVVVAYDNATTITDTIVIENDGRGQNVLNFHQEIHRNLQLQISGTSPLTLYGYSTELTRVSVSELSEQRNAYATSLLFAEYAHLFYIYLSHISTADIFLSITVDGIVTDTYQFAATGGFGVIRKDWRVLKARKGKLFGFHLESDEEFQVIPEQSLVMAKEFKDSGAYRQMPVFGDTT